jgi:hypothetical protein
VQVSCVKVAIFTEKNAYWDRASFTICKYYLCIEEDNCRFRFALQVSFRHMHKYNDRAINKNIYH